MISEWILKGSILQEYLVDLKGLDDQAAIGIFRGSLEEMVGGNPRKVSGWFFGTFHKQFLWQISCGISGEISGKIAPGWQNRDI